MKKDANNYYEHDLKKSAEIYNVSLEALEQWEKNRFKLLNIGEISKIFGIPVTTLHRWEKEGLIFPNRNEKNNYRVFRANHVIVDLLDVIFYRNIDMPLKEVKRVLGFPLKELKEALKEKRVDIQQKIETYLEMISMLDKRIEIMEEIENYYGTFREAEIPFERTILLDYGNKELIKMFFEDSSCFVTLGNTHNADNDIQSLIVPDDYPGETVFTKNPADKYLMSFYRIEVRNEPNNDYFDVYEKLQKLGYKSKSIISQFLINMADENGHVYVYFRVWFKLENE